MYMSTHALTCIHTYVHTYVHTCTITLVFRYLYTYNYIYTYYKYIYIYLFIYLFICLYLYLASICICSYMYTCIHKQIWTPHRHHSHHQHHHLTIELLKPPYQLAVRAYRVSVPRRNAAYPSPMQTRLGV